MAAAGEVFAEQGYRNATVREICQRAGANVASVNYHFGDKETLYAEVLRSAHACAMAMYPPDMGLHAGASVEQRLHAFVRSFLFRVFGEGRPAWHGKLTARELADPTPALGAIVDESVRPNFAVLRAIVIELLSESPDGGRTPAVAAAPASPPADPVASADAGDDAGVAPTTAPDPDQVRYHAWSVVGQSLFYFYARPIISRLHPAQSFGAADVEALARHITDFSLAAMRCRAQGPPPNAGGGR